jgi:DNA-binding PadR family transcriptional regulator
MTDMSADKTLFREILLAFWKVHILHHAGERPVVGQWMLKELRHHGYDVSPGTLYPLLRRLEAHGWLCSNDDPGGHPRAPRHYRLTAEGRRALDQARGFLDELREELGEPEAPR